MKAAKSADKVFKSLSIRGDIVGVGNALVDETFYVDKQFVDSTDLLHNQFKAITFEQELILSNLPQTNC